MSRDWDKELGDFLRAAGDPVGDDAPPMDPPVDPPVVAYLRGLLANGDVARATKVVVLASYVDDEGCEHVGRFHWGASLSEQLGLVAYHYERLRRFVVGADEED